MNLTMHDNPLGHGTPTIRKQVETFHLSVDRMLIRSQEDYQPPRSYLFTLGLSF